jgi:hypothetical protein
MSHVDIHYNPKPANLYRLVAVFADKVSDVLHLAAWSSEPTRAMGVVPVYIQPAEERFAQYLQTDVIVDITTDLEVILCDSDKFSSRLFDSVDETISGWGGIIIEASVCVRITAGGPSNNTFRRFEFGSRTKSPISLVPRC